MSESLVPAMPKCPDCKAQPLPCMMHEVTTPMGLILGMVTCCTCGYVLTTFPLGMKEPFIVNGIVSGKGLRN